MLMAFCRKELQERQKEVIVLRNVGEREN